MGEANQTILSFEEVGKEDISLVGGKGANLGEMLRHGIPVPPGFVVTAPAYSYFLEESRLKAPIQELLDKLDTSDTKALQEISARIKELITEAPMPGVIAEAIEQAYRKLGGGPVAVRSSATAEDLPEASFAGQQKTFLNVRGEKEVVKAVQDCWASLFEPRAIFYRAQHRFGHLDIAIAVPVQRMVQSNVSGVMFTVEPVTSDSSKIVIEAVFGLGEAIVSGEVTPDLYVVDKGDFQIVEKKVGRQEWQLIRNPLRWGAKGEANIKVTLLPHEQTLQKLSDQEVLKLARLGKQIEDHYNFPQDIEWAREGREFFIVQTRPVTTMRAREETLPEIDLPLLLTGGKGSPGIGSGPVKIVPDASEISKVAKGDVLVAKVTNPDFVPAMKRAVAIVTDEGGRTSHAAIVSRELGIPCVVGTSKATHVLKDGTIITVDGSQGKVHLGRATVSPVRTAPVVRRALHTKTRVYVNLAEPEKAEEVAARDVDGVGLLRAEFIIAQIGLHPRYVLARGRQEEFISRLTEGLTTFARAFHPRPVVYRTTDFKTNEYCNLEGGAEYEREEENPMLGYRGCSRYIREKDAFQLEIEAIKRTRDKYSNLWVMVPFVRTVEELARTKELLEAGGLKASADFKLWMMTEVPSNIFLLDKFIDVGIDGISIGSNDLTQLILGIDRDNTVLAQDFDERNEAVMLALEQAIKNCARRGITSSICGQAPSVYPEITEKLVEWGITSVSVSPDMIDRVREMIAEVEARLATPSRLRRQARSWEEEEG
jgi:pyruvate,water dikinase